MKSTFSAIILVALVTGCTVATKAQSNVIKFNPLSLALSTLNVKYERAITKRITAQVGGLYSFYGFKSRGEEFKYDVKGITPEVRYYILPKSQEAPQGLFAGVLFSYRHFDLREVSRTVLPTDRVIKFDRIGGGVLGGYQLIVKNWLSLEGYAGIKYFQQDIKQSDISIDLGDFRGGFASNLGPYDYVFAGVAAGIAF